MNKIEPKENPWFKVKLVKKQRCFSNCTKSFCYDIIYKKYVILSISSGCHGSVPKIIMFCPRTKSEKIYVTSD